MAENKEGIQRSVVVFEHVDTFDVTGRGRVYTGYCPFDIKGHGLDVFNAAIEEHGGIEIDGVVYEKVRGVETFASFNPFFKGSKIGILP